MGGNTKIGFLIFKMSKLTFLTFLVTLSAFTAQAQLVVSGSVLDASTSEPIPFAHVQIEDSTGVVTNLAGDFVFESVKQGTYALEVTFVGYKLYKKIIKINKKSISLNILLELDAVSLAQVDLVNQRTTQTNITRLRSVEGTAIYASKKNEVILMDLSMANKATNNSRQVYSKVPGLNIWESDGLGLQLEIGARGLSPHRTSNFNTRQNGYDISADALGYPESYYTPPSEAIEKIEIVRGAASLQYGTQFGGLLNFVLKKGSDKPIEVVARQSLGSFQLQNTFLSIGGTKGKWNYYSFYQIKSREGWRPNSSTEAQTFFFSSEYQANSKLKIGFEFTHMDYLSQQPGGLDDATFLSSPSTSFRSRNWFQVDWNIAAFTLDYNLSERTTFNSRTFGLWARKDALGILDTQYVPDSVIMEDKPNRDLRLAEFNNIGNETRLVHRYLIGQSESALLVGMRVYKGFTTKAQGNADSSSKPNFSFKNKFDHFGSLFEFPSFNSSFFAENFIRVNDCFSITPGFRFDHIKTQSSGYFHSFVNDSVQFTNNSKTLTRGIFLAGIGASYHCFVGGELYANFAQNYRAINFNDMQVINSSIVVDPNLEDEKGFNIDLGLRGKVWDAVEYDLSLFYLNYSNRIGYLQEYYTPENAPSSYLIYKSYRLSTNIGDSRTLGFESYIGWDLLKTFSDVEHKSLNIFVNTSYQKGTYIRSQEKQLIGNTVELNPNLNLKLGAQYRYKKFTSSLLLSHTSSQFTDAENTITATPNALFGEIPSYSVIDLSTKYQTEKLLFEAGVNNLLDRSYFTRRASGYPGPGIIPSDKRNYYFSLQIKI